MTQVDTKALLRLRDVIGGDAEELAEFIDDFSAIAPELVGTMESSVTSCDWNALKIAAHSLKSNSKDLGVVALADLCAALEQESALGEVSDVQQKVGQISTEMQLALSALQALDLTTI